MTNKRKLDLTETQEKKFSMARLSQQFKDTIQNKMMDKFHYSNVHQIPKLSKIVLNMGIGDAKEDAKILDKAQEELSLIAGQKAIKTKAKKAIAAGAALEDVVNVGDKVKVKVIEIDNRGRVKLSIKEALLEEGGAAAESQPVPDAE